MVRLLTRLTEAFALKSRSGYAAPPKVVVY